MSVGEPIGDSIPLRWEKSGRKSWNAVMRYDVYD